VRIQYIDASYRRTERVIEPLRTYRGRNGETYLEAFCRLRGEKRTFRLDRIASWVVEEVPQRVAAAASPPALTPCPPAPAAAAASSSPLPLPAPSRTPAIAVPHPRPMPRLTPPTAAANLAASAASPSQRKPRRSGGWAWALCVAGIVVLSHALFPSREKPVPTPPYFPPAPALTGAVRRPPATRTAAAARSSPAQAPAPERTARNLTYRGVAVTATPEGEQGWRYTAPELGLQTRTRRRMHLGINAALFRRATGVASEELERRYAAADADRDGYLSWAELEAFQRELGREFRYLANPTALRPDEFLAQGGGDCEDWALMSCGLLRYWGWTAYVGSFVAPGGGEPHAVCLVRSEHRPARYAWFTVAQALTQDGASVPPGDYVPVDYEHVGGLSNAVGRNWRLERFYRPERLYAQNM
jgi:hypothetical protein